MERSELEQESETKAAPALPELFAPELARPRAPEAPPAPAPARVPFERTHPLEEESEHAEYLARRNFGSLDGLRALGILAVVWHHTVGGPGGFGANLFFLLSGFLVTTLLVREQKKNGTVALARFRARRAQRLYPLYFTVLFAYVGLVLCVERDGPARDEFLRNVPFFATFTSNLFVGLEGERTIFYFAWSLAAQEQFYLLWPWLVKHARKLGAALAAGALIAASVLTRAGALDALLPEQSLVRALALSLMPPLALGALVALALDTRRGYELARRVVGWRGASVALFAGALLLWRQPGLGPWPMYAVLTLLATACVVREDHLLARLLKQPALVHVGLVSFGIYLSHMLCHNVVERVLAHLGAGFAPFDFVLTAALSIAVATLSFRHFEPRFWPADKRQGPLQARASK
ncbi:MAG: acyltransferase [Planctomycetota bacterium]